MSFFSHGEVTCHARLGNEYGVLTAAHVIAGGDDELKYSLRANDTVSCSKATSSSPCGHRILAIDPVMDAALVKAETGPDEPEKKVQAMEYVGFLPIRIKTPRGTFDSMICETEVPQGIIPGSPGKRPSDPALLFSVASGTPGWSGSMVIEKVSGKPYCMFQGARQVHNGKLGTARNAETARDRLGNGDYRAS